MLLSVLYAEEIFTRGVKRKIRIFEKTVKKSNFEFEPILFLLYSSESSSKTSASGRCSTDTPDFWSNLECVIGVYDITVP